jgi:hypothetical protein
LAHRNFIRTINQTKGSTRALLPRMPLELS